MAFALRIRHQAPETGCFLHGHVVAAWGVAPTHSDQEAVLVPAQRPKRPARIHRVGEPAAPSDVIYPPRGKRRAVMVQVLDVLRRGRVLGRVDRDRAGLGPLGIEGAALGECDLFACFGHLRAPIRRIVPTSAHVIAPHGEWGGDALSLASPIGAR